MNLIIDIGNSVAKLAIFDKGELVEVFRGSNHSLDCLPMLCSRYPLKRGIIASVITLSNTIRHQLERLPFNIIELSHETPVPVTNLYKTPQTLGMDRLAAVVAANWLKPGHDVLVIDAGTCVTYDFIDADGAYHGGNISPGTAYAFQGIEHIHRQTSQSNALKEKFRCMDNLQKRLSGQESFAEWNLK